MTQVLKDWLRANQGSFMTASYMPNSYTVKLLDCAGCEVGDGSHCCGETAERLAVLNATGELEAEDG
jgi:hypothetical protein